MASALQQKTTHLPEVLGRLPEQFKNNVEMRAMLKSWVTQIVALEAACFQVLTAFDLDSAVGKQLDILGRIVGVKRDGRTDARYRIRLRAQIKLNRTSGTINQLLELLTLLIESGQTLKLTEYFPAAFTVKVSGTTPSEEVAGETAKILQVAKVGGVGASLIYALFEQANTFAFSSAAGTNPADTARGWANALGTTGGYLAGVFGPPEAP